VTLVANTEDIAAYIAHKIDEDKMDGMDDDFKEQIAKEIVSASQGMFVICLACLVFTNSQADMITGSYCPHYR
jgi:hypothetical protein